MQDVLPTLDRWREAGRRAAIATVTRVHGSSPRPAGARLAIADDGEFVGSISVGCVEADVFEDAQEVLRTGRPKHRHFGIADEVGFTVGLSCGGEIDVWIEPDWLSALPEAAVAAELRHCLAAEAGACLVTTLPDAGQLRHMLVRVDGTCVGLIGDLALHSSIVADARRLLDRGVSDTIDYPQAAGGSLAAFLDAYPPPPTLLIFGGTSVAVPLAAFA
ncbi:MAG TPA: XdhC family protein, partial [Chloroflexota bacterium]